MQEMKNIFWLPQSVILYIIHLFCLSAGLRKNYDIVYVRADMNHAADPGWVSFTLFLTFGDRDL